MRKFLLVFTLMAAWAQPPEPKNLKVLKVPAADLIPIMRSFSAGLGVECDFCHVKGNFASDDNPHKEIARKMIVMAEQINSNFPDGKCTSPATPVTAAKKSLRLLPQPETPKPRNTSTNTNTSC